jgi:hypothetical protein
MLNVERRMRIVPQPYADTVKAIPTAVHEASIGEIETPSK